ncbi:unnamed protein product [Symbiodinium sp. CCMP2592]|nr:unnamed protein product [Symbiodinium sp. CCMP2592]
MTSDLMCLVSVTITGTALKEHVVVLEFRHRKLPFVFAEELPAQRFLLCLELLIWRVQEETALDNSMQHRIVPLFRKDQSEQLGGAMGFCDRRV